MLLPTLLLALLAAATIGHPAHGREVVPGNSGDRDDSARDSSYLNITDDYQQQQQRRQRQAAVNKPAASAVPASASMPLPSDSSPLPAGAVTLRGSRYLLTTKNNNNPNSDWISVPIIVVIVVIVACACNLCFKMRSRRKPQQDQELPVDAAAAAAAKHITAGAVAAMLPVVQEPPQPMPPAMTEPESASAHAIPRPPPMHPPGAAGHSLCVDMAGPHGVKTELVAIGAAAAASASSINPGRAQQEITQIQERHLQAIRQQRQQQLRQLSKSYLNLQSLQHRQAAQQQMPTADVDTSLEHPAAGGSAIMEISRASQQPLSPRSWSVGSRLMIAARIDGSSSSDRTQMAHEHYRRHGSLSPRKASAPPQPS
ncbi:hypothetical protein Vretimale_2288 [Volvox reticuliferus]|nr:hypothetical protein Vretimale_2288 [Volvox reticuliferus]